MRKLHWELYRHQGPRHWPSSLALTLPITPMHPLVVSGLHQTVHSMISSTMSHSNVLHLLLSLFLTTRLSLASPLPPAEQAQARLLSSDGACAAVAISLPTIPRDQLDALYKSACDYPPFDGAAYLSALAPSAITDVLQATGPSLNHAIHQACSADLATLCSTAPSDTPNPPPATRLATCVDDTVHAFFTTPASPALPHCTTDLASLHAALPSTKRHHSTPMAALLSNGLAHELETDVASSTLAKRTSDGRWELQELEHARAVWLAHKDDRVHHTPAPPAWQRIAKQLPPHPPRAAAPPLNDISLSRGPDEPPRRARSAEPEHYLDFDDLDDADGGPEESGAEGLDYAAVLRTLHAEAESFRRRGKRDELVEAVPVLPHPHRSYPKPGHYYGTADVEMAARGE